MAQIVIGQHQTGHRFDDRNGARHYARIVPPFGFQDSRISSRIDCFLRLQQSGDGFEGYAETDVHPIGNTPWIPRNGWYASRSGHPSQS